MLSLEADDRELKEPQLGKKPDRHTQLELKLSHGQTVTVELGSTKAEDLLCDLGSPDRRYWKEDVST